MAEGKLPEANDLVWFEYTGRVLSSGVVFDTSDAETAKRAGLFDRQGRYGKQLVAFGRGGMVKGLEAALRGMSEGESQQVELAPPDAFGEKLPGLVRVMPERLFHENGLQPAPGMQASLDGKLARVKSVGGGRVTVDFNHPLAGERVAYQVKLHQVLRTDDEKANALREASGLVGDVRIDGGKLRVTLAKESAVGQDNSGGLQPGERHHAFARFAARFLPGLKVEFANAESAEKPEAGKKAEERAATGTPARAASAGKPAAGLLAPKAGAKNK